MGNDPDQYGAIMHVSVVFVVTGNVCNYRYINVKVE